MGKWPDFEYHGGKWLKNDRSGFNSSHPSLGSPLNLGDHWWHAWECLKLAKMTIFRHVANGVGLCFKTQNGALIAEREREQADKKLSKVCWLCFLSTPPVSSPDPCGSDPWWLCAETANLARPQHIQIYKRSQQKINYEKRQSNPAVSAANIFCKKAKSISISGHSVWAFLCKFIPP